jgi:hypothetical protein
VHVPLPGTLWPCRHPHDGVAWQAAGVAGQRVDGVLPGIPPIVISQYWVYDWHWAPALPHEKHGAGATSTRCQTPFEQRVRLQN